MNENDENDELSYEEEQLQLILMNEHKEKQLEEERQIKELQDREYQESLAIDEKKVEVEIKEITIEEMRRIRLQRFCK
jgi:hypothetical protein